MPRGKRLTDEERAERGAAKTAREAELKAQKAATKALHVLKLKQKKVKRAENKVTDAKRDQAEYMREVADVLKADPLKSKRLKMGRRARK